MKTKSILIKVSEDQHKILRSLAAKKGVLLTPYVTKIITGLADRNDPKKRDLFTQKK